MTGSVVISGAAAAFACLSGADTLVTVGPGLAVPPMIAFFLSHWLLSFGLLMGGTFGASMVARKPGVNVFALFALAAVIGLVIAPTIYFAQVRANAGATLSAQPVLMAFGVATAGFAGLSTYALVTKRDFSFMRGFLTMGLFVVIGASILSLFSVAHPSPSRSPASRCSSSAASFSTTLRESCARARRKRCPPRSRSISIS